jgi:hypothetical protein
MKNIFTSTVVIASLITFSATAQFSGLNASTAITKVNSETIATASGATSITMDVEINEKSNWFTAFLNDYTALGEVDGNAKIQGVVITMEKANTADEVIYDDVIKLFVPASLSFDGAKNQTVERSDLVSTNKASIAPWATGAQKVAYGTAYDNWGLDNVSLNDLKEFGLGIEFKADANGTINITNIKATIFFSNGTSIQDAVNSFR